MGADSVMLANISSTSICFLVTLSLFDYRFLLVSTCTNSYSCTRDELLFISVTHRKAIQKCRQSTKKLCNNSIISPISLDNSFWTGIEVEAQQDLYITHHHVISTIDYLLSHSTHVYPTNHCQKQQQLLCTRISTADYPLQLIY